MSRDLCSYCETFVLSSLPSGTVSRIPRFEGLWKDLSFPLLYPQPSPWNRMRNSNILLSVPSCSLVTLFSEAEVIHSIDSSVSLLGSKTLLNSCKAYMIQKKTYLSATE